MGAARRPSALRGRQHHGDMPGMPTRYRPKGVGVSGYKHSGMSREDYEAREQIRQASLLIEERWPGAHPILLTELEMLIEQVESEAHVKACNE